MSYSLLSNWLAFWCASHILAEFLLGLFINEPVRQILWNKLNISSIHSLFVPLLPSPILEFDITFHENWTWNMLSSNVCACTCIKIWHLPPQLVGLIEKQWEVWDSIGINKNQEPIIYWMSSQMISTEIFPCIDINSRIYYFLLLGSGDEYVNFYV
jgi:hypothetical protein